ncbi:MAG: NAD(P)/FAD-dependent oxidoreductase [Hyphomonas sp.]|uniref:NAD(P)/FAD-dependent oxidoreductase n=1 Tax=Hyphomonas sp. TaxID=87 RepID=UPI00182CE7AE|nr:FAD-dependent oxidoreductase [Hyphomonas sp.]MBA3068755.1 NAD(P)/FAD-dependent oxidoreductase [Hyphomonas sp.]MBU3922422.1 FAD-dependent oxidoreductase [Alphaproteobacteria bacterium]MBU4062688.1 FAD-dependent oxidoreductase [Alphaproteobacteria bacterium]MBU4166196.1 FAD-dependent oxidoreductase [Alphaproteobacteria bacterium]
MAKIVVLGAGLGGALAAYEIRKAVRREDEVVAINENTFYQFLPSNPWVLVGWRDRKDIVVELAGPMKKRGIGFIVGKAQKVEPDQKRVQLADGTAVSYDYLVIATGPELAFDEIEGLGPGGFTQSVCHIDHATQANLAFEEFCKDPGPIVVGAVQGASCYGPAYETAMIIETELRKRKIRDRVPMTYVTSEPYVGHLGLDGVGDTKSLLESEMRERHIKWITNARVLKAEAGKMTVEELNEDGSVKQVHELPMKFSMMLPAFRGVGAVRDVEGLSNPRGFILIDKHQRNPKYPEIFGIGVCIAIPPTGKTPVPVGVPKTGFMIESMVTATAQNLGEIVRGKAPSHEATWNAICLADFGDKGVAFVAQPQIPPRNVNWSGSGGWVHTAKVGFERYFLAKIKAGKSETFYENAMLGLMQTHKIKPD